MSQQAVLCPSEASSRNHRLLERTQMPRATGSFVANALDMLQGKTE
jgi:hypothetical protein